MIRTLIKKMVHPKKQTRIIRMIRTLIKNGSSKKTNSDYPNDSYFDVCLRHIVTN
jgi:hypothetical protein